MIESKDFTNLGFPPDADAGAADVADFAADGLADSAEQVGDVAGVQEQIDKLRADPAYLDLNDRNPAQHRKVVAEINRLTEKKMAGQPSPTDKMFAELQAEQVKKQEAQHAAAMADYDWLGENGFESVSEPPENIPPHLAEGWKQQRRLAEDDFVEFGDSMEKSITELRGLGKLPPGKISALREIISVEGIHPGLVVAVKRVADALNRLVYDAYELKK